ncbi:TetR/AcrR family transcriptional regulator [Nocardia rhizosphaerihabitans]|uniref:TetR family transcriptional regulator n=1 Tax=Nocardia rhizosphaerihabitans TaxID=1691570 RepID=A0ABQ2KWI7_9NOCA|nr:TetR/AcrR family transcriptional regulator [Nocardia rhizosphaerihabitans]GGN93730.1 TetR family transcriptional regulator [Nocardia rhizosphaerihabitans]
MAYLARAARRDSMVEAAATVVAREGLSAVTARAVASEFGGSQGQIHHHFASTDDLAADAWRRYADREVEAYQRAVADLDPYTALTLFFADLIGESGDEGHALARWAEAGAHAQIRGPVAISYVETLTQLTDVLTAVLSGVLSDATEARASAARLLMLGVGLAGITRITDDPPLPVRTVMLSAIRAEIN